MRTLLWSLIATAAVLFTLGGCTGGGWQGETHEEWLHSPSGPFFYNYNNNGGGANDSGHSGHGGGGHR